MNYTESLQPFPTNTNLSHHEQQFHQHQPVSPSGGTQFAGLSMMLASDQRLLMQQQQPENMLFANGLNAPVYHDAPFPSTAFENEYQNRIVLSGNSGNEQFFLNDSGTHSGSHRSAASTSGRTSHLDVPMDWGDVYGSNSGSVLGSGLQSGIISPLRPHSMQHGSTTPLTNFNNEEDVVEQLRITGEHLVDRDPIVSAKAAGVLHRLSSTQVSYRQAICRSEQIMRSMIHIIGAREIDDTTRKSCASTLYVISNDTSNDGELLQAIMDYGGVSMLRQMFSESIESLLYCSLATVHNLLHNKKAARDQFLAGPGIIQDMVMLLKRDNVRCLLILTDCFRILLQHSRQTRLDFHRNGGCEKLMLILCTQKETSNCDGFTCCNNPNCDSMAQPQQPKRCSKCERVVKLRLHVVKTLKILASCKDNKLQIVRAGGMMGLSRHVRDDYEDTALNCLITLRNLSDIAGDAGDSQEVLAMLIDLLAQYSQAITNAAEPLPAVYASNYHQVLMYATGTVHNLTCNKPMNKQTVCDRNGIYTMLHVLDIATHAVMMPDGPGAPMSAEHADEFAESALCTLKNLTAKHVEADSAQQRVIDCGGLVLLQNYLLKFVTEADRTQQQRLRPIMEAVCGIMRNVTLPENSHDAMMGFNKTLIPKYMQQMLLITVRNCESIDSQQKQRRSMLLEQFSGNVDAVAKDPEMLKLKNELTGNEKLLDVCMYALQALVALNNKGFQAGVMPTSNLYYELVTIAVPLLFYPTSDTKVHRTTTGLLSELANDRSKGHAISDQLQASPQTWAHLKNLCSNPDEKANVAEKELYNKLPTRTPVGADAGLMLQYGPVSNKNLPSPVTMASSSSNNPQFYQRPNLPKELSSLPRHGNSSNSSMQWPSPTSVLPANPANTPEQQFSNQVPPPYPPRLQKMPNSRNFGSGEVFVPQQPLPRQSVTNSQINSMQNMRMQMLPNQMSSRPNYPQPQTMPSRYDYPSNNIRPFQNNFEYADNDLVQALSSIDFNNDGMPITVMPTSYDHQNQQQQLPQYRAVHPQPYRPMAEQSFAFADHHIMPTSNPMSSPVGGLFQQQQNHYNQHYQQPPVFYSGQPSSDFYNLQ